MIHFRDFPRIEYSENLSVNIMVRGKIRDAILEKKALYYDYRIPEGMRPDVLASKYYGNSNATWALFYANNIFDPRFEWPMNGEDFNSFIKNKYGSVEAAQNILGEPHHYLLDDTYIIDKTTYLDETIDFDRKKAVTNYEYELDLNDKRSTIKVLDVIYLRQLTNELEKLFKG